MKKRPKNRPIETIYILKDLNSNDYRVVQIDIESKSTRKLDIDQDIKDAGSLLLGHPEYANCEIINITPLDEMGYFQTKTKMTLI